MKGKIITKFCNTNFSKLEDKVVRSFSSLTQKRGPKIMPRVALKVLQI